VASPAGAGATEPSGTGSYLRALKRFVDEDPG
jgi:hypothetical protein